MNGCHPKSFFLPRLLATGLVALSLTACSSIVSNHGNTLDAVKLSRIEPGKSRLIEVEALFGRPSVAGAFDSGKVYYIAQVMEEAPGGKKTPISRTIVTFTYDDKGIVTALDITDEETGRNVFHIDEKTPTPGDTYGILDQIFSNVSRAPASSQ
jgi:outer membrane protein assembly factor BamE (lipoprotein component of BamABCDE complex)